MEETSVSGNDGDLMDESVSLGEELPVDEMSDPADARSDLDRAFESVDLSLLNEAEVEDLESGDPDRVEKAVLAAQKGNRGAGNDGDERLPSRISLKSIPTREEKRSLIEATQLLRDGKAMNLREALDLVAGVASPSAAQPMAELQEPKLAPSVEQVTTPFGMAPVQAIEARLAELQKQRDECRGSYDFETADELLAKMVEARMELREAHKEAAASEVRVAEFAKAEDVSRNIAMDRYAELLTAPKNEFNDWLDVEITLAEKRNDPILMSPDWPEKIADRTFQKHMVRAGGGSADPDSGRFFYPTPPVPRTGVRMPGSPVGGGANSMALTASAAMSEFDRLSPEEQKDVLDRLDKVRL